MEVHEGDTVVARLGALLGFRTSITLICFRTR